MPEGNNKPLSMPAVFTPGFFKPSPIVCTPLRNDLLIPLPCTACRFLGAAREAAQHVPDARRTIGTAKVAFNDRSDPLKYPEIMTKAMSPGALAQEAES